MRRDEGEPRSRAPACRMSAMGSGACLLDAAGPAFDEAVQERIWAAARAARAIPGVLEAVPGMNNLLVVFDPLRTRSGAVERTLSAAWRDAEPEAIVGRDFTFAVLYGGPKGQDLDGLARHAGLPAEELVRRHAAASYTVAAIGAMPGFPYLSGLDPALAWARRPSPRLSVIEGAVIVGGAQAAIMPCTAPSGWHIIGWTQARLFEPTAAEPALLRPGDRVRFTVAGLAS